MVVEHGLEGIAVGDVILYRATSSSLGWGEGLVAHRVVKVLGDSGDRLVTRGEGRCLPDPPVDRKQIIGRVISVHKADGIPPEDQLLLLCARSQVDATGVEKMQRLLDGPLDWGYLLQAAVRQAIPQLLFHNLRRRETGNKVPPRIMDRLAKIYYANVFRHQRFSRALEEVLEALQRAGIEVIVLKGMALAPQVYPDPALRQCGDIDLLVRKDDLPSVERILLELGYTVGTEEHQAEQLGRHHYHLSYWRDGGRLKLEVHWDLLPHPNPFSLSLDELWARARCLSIGRAETLALSPEDSLLHLCLHASFPPYFLLGAHVPLRVLCDIAEIIRCYPITWQHLVANGRRYQVAGHLYGVLCVAEQLLQVDVPDEVLEALRPPAFDPRWAEALEASILNWGSSGKLPYGLLRLLAARGIGDKLRTLRDIFLATPQVRSQKDGASPGLQALLRYHVTRPFYLLSRWGRLLLSAAIDPRHVLPLGVERQHINEWLTRQEEKGGVS